MIAYRGMDEGDRKFVIDSWAKSFRESEHAGLIQMSDWFPIMIVQIGKVLTRPEVETIIAYDPTDTDRVADIYGWLCCEPLRIPPLVYYMFVKSPYRRRGIASGLLKHAHIKLDRPVEYACRTYVVDELDRGRWIARHAPYASFRPLAGRR